MSLGKFLISFIAIYFTLSTVAISASEARPRRVAKKRHKTFSKLAFGVGLMIYDEEIEAKEGNVTEVGYGNYAGFTLFADQSWTRHRWSYGGSVGIAMGKASAGGFGSITYSDSGRRNWNMGFLEAYTFYRVRPLLMVGGGLFTGYRTADWESTVNSQLEVKDTNRFILGPEFLLRWFINPEFALNQGLVIHDEKGTSLWRWSANIYF